MTVTTICDFSADVQRHFSELLRRDGVDFDVELAKARAEHPAAFYDWMSPGGYACSGTTSTAARSAERLESSAIQPS
jgi:hypothetical protein